MSSDKHFFDMAVEISASSAETGKRVGAVIVGPDGKIRTSAYNGLPDRVRDMPERYVRETGAKYLWSVHAEVNAICAAASEGIVLKGCTIYSTHFPCVGCAKAIIQSGIVCVVSPAPDFNDPKWSDEWRVSEQMFAEAGVEHTVIV